MIYRTKFYKEKLKNINSSIVNNEPFDIKNAVNLLKLNSKKSKFNETFELSVKLNIDTKQTDQIPRGFVVLEHGIGKKCKILVIVKEEQIDSIKNIGVDHVGSDDMIEKIKNGWIDFDVFITTPDFMPKIRNLGKLLGPKGLMPNIKTGTLTNDVISSINDAKKGKVEIKVDKGGCVHIVFGKISFEDNQLIENFNSIINEIIKLRPKKVKGKYIESCSICTTMSSSVKVKLNNNIL